MRVLKNFLYLMIFKIEKTQFYSEFSMRDIITLVVIISVAHSFMGSLWDHRLAPLIFFMPVIVLSGMSLTLFFLVKMARAYTNYYGLFTLVSLLSSVTLIVYPLWHIGEIYNQPFLVFTAFFITTYTLFALSFCL